MSTTTSTGGSVRGRPASGLHGARERHRHVVAPVVPRLTPIVFSHASGSYLFDVDGRAYLDFNTGVAVCAVGHCHPEVVRAIQEQAASLVHANNGLGCFPPYGELLAAVLARAPGELADGQGLLVTGGAEAIDAALKLARYITRRPGVLSFLGAFHGRGLGALSVTASQAGYRRAVWAQTGGVVYAPFPTQGTPLYSEADPARAEAMAIEAVETLLNCVVPPEELAAVIVEPIQGEGGYRVPTDGFLPYLRELCDRTGALLIADEIQTGLGRTGRWFAVEHWRVVPDILCVGKPLGGGLPLGGVLARRDLLAGWPAGTHGSTFGGNPLACKAGVKTLEIINRDGLVARAAQVGEDLVRRLRTETASLPEVSEVRGKGLMIGVELRRQDGSPAIAEAARCTEIAAERGLLVSRCGLHTIRIAPPLTVTADEARQGVARLVESIEHAFHPA